MKQHCPQQRLGDLRQGSALFVLCWLAYFASYLGRYNYSAAMGTLMEQGLLPVSVAGAVSTAYFLSYSAGQLVNGVLGARLSPYKMIFTGLLCSGLANLAMGLVPPTAMLAVWACNGFFQSMLWPPIVRIFSEALPERQQKMACVNITSTTPAGTLVSFGLSALALAAASWRGVFWVCGAAMLGFALVWWVSTAPFRSVTQPLSPAESPARQTPPVNTKTAAPHIKTPSVPRLLALSGLVWLLLPVALHGALKDGMTTWVPAFVQSNFAVTSSFSVLLSMLLPVVNLSGAYVAVWLDRRWFQNEVKTTAALFFAACAALAALPLAFRAGPYVCAALLAVTTSCMLGVNTLLIGVIPVKAGRQGGAAFLSGLLNAVTYVGAAASTWGSGVVVEHWGWLPAALLWLGFAGVGAVLCLAPVRRWARFSRAQTEVAAN